jgi:flagellar protein FlbD
MIRVTRLNHTPLVLNCDLIESIEATPDTVVSMTTGQRIMVLEGPEVIVERVAEFRRSVLRPILTGADSADLLAPAAAWQDRRGRDGR